MASAQVLTDSGASSRKQGHLEAGKKKLEEFRKRKAEGRAKKTESTGQLQSIDGGSIEKSSQNEEHEGGVTNFSTNTGLSSFHTTPVQKEAFSSTDKHVISSNENTQISNPFEKSSYRGLVNGYHDQWKERSELSDNEQFKFETTSATSDQFVTFDSSHTDVNLEENLGSLSLFPAPLPAPLDESRNSSARVGYLEASNAGLQKAEGDSAESRFGIPSVSLGSSSTSKDSVPGSGIYNPSGFNNKGRVDTQVGRKTISETISQHLNLGSAFIHSSEPSLTDSSLQIRRPQEAHLSSSTSYGVTSSRSRPSFLDTLGVSRASSTSHAPLFELQKANPPVSFSDSMVQSADVHFFPHQQPFIDVNSVQPLSTSSPTVMINEKDNSFASSNEILMLETSREYGRHEILVSKKDEDFSALEQHIEDLTQEKFTLQRALDTARSLADSLAAENSSLTETYNHQGKVVSELKSEIERLQQEVKYQLREVESLKLEFGNAQLECDAADERAKILASEVIGLEEKALRLRSNELKLEKQSENLSSEIASYKRKVSILERERQDFQSTINVMQEEKKLLQNKLRKASSNSKVDDVMRITSSRRDMSTSTDDLGDGIDKQTNEAEKMTNNTMSVLQNNTVWNDFVATSSSLPDGISIYLPGDSVGIPQDQLRMIDNISSLLSEFTLEKEELMQALKIETSDNSKLKDLNNELSRKLEAQTQRLELLTAQRMANENILTNPTNTHNIPDTMEYADEGDEVVERVLGWILKFFPGGSSKRRTSKLL